MMEIINGIEQPGPKAYHTQKTLVFDGGTVNGIGDFDGTGNPTVLFTVTGDVRRRIIAICSQTLVFGANATIEVGIAGATASTIAQTNLTTQGLAVDEVWHDATPDSSVELLTVAEEQISGGGKDVILTVGTANVTAGQIEFYCSWFPLSVDGRVVSA